MYRTNADGAWSLCHLSLVPGVPWGEQWATDADIFREGGNLAHRERAQVL